MIVHISAVAVAIDRLVVVVIVVIIYIEIAKMVAIYAFDGWPNLNKNETEKRDEKKTSKMNGKAKNFDFDLS